MRRPIRHIDETSRISCVLLAGHRASVIYVMNTIGLPRIEISPLRAATERSEARHDNARQCRDAGLVTKTEEAISSGWS